MSISCRRLRRQLVRLSGYRGLGRQFGRLAGLGVPSFHAREILAKLHPSGFVDPDTQVSHPRMEFGRHVYLGKDVSAFSDRGGEAIVFGDHVSVYGRTLFRTGENASIRLGENTHVQMGCTFVACLSSISIGKQVEIAADCSFYSFSHGVEAGSPVMEQKLTSKGPIEVGDGAWLGHGVTVLQGTRIGEGAVIGAGSVVTRDVPDNAIAVGVPAKVLGYR